jgi:hypothetical protein
MSEQYATGNFTEERDDASSLLGGIRSYRMELAGAVANSGGEFSFCSSSAIHFRNLSYVLTNLLNNFFILLRLI